MENYNNEQEHDWCLIYLVRALDETGRLDIFRDAFRIEEDLGPLRWSGRRRAFDVELEFANLSVAIETKVHSNEDGGDGEQWQTERIAEQRRGVRGQNFFITYGTSEFYTKPYEPGPASPEFQHITLERMIHLVESSLAALPQIRQSTDSVEWLRLMRLEKEKREKAQELLHSFAQFRTRYLEVHGENDFPRGRVAFSAPELAFPVFSKLVEHWDKSEYVAKFGRLSVYPVGRRPPVDSILNFWEIWDEGPALAPDIVGSEQSLYLEVNEDFNLNLKLDEGQAGPDEEQKEKIWERLCGARWPSSVNACRRDYRQNSRVLYEVDFGFLANVDSLSEVVSNLGRTLEVIFGALNNDRE